MAGSRITLDYIQFKAMEAELDRLRTAAATDTPRTPTGGREAVALEALQAALPVVQFAVANLDPRTVRGWPAGELERLGVLLVTALPEHAVLALALQTFARECHEVDGFRAERTAEALVAAALGELADDDGGSGA